MVTPASASSSPATTSATARREWPRVIDAQTERDFQIAGTLVGKFTSAGLAVTGNITATGNITGGQGGSDQIDMLHHVHQYIPGSGSPTNTGQPVAGS
jgi:hypothetical protein